MARRSVPRKRFSWLNPEVALYFGYALYVADDPENKGTRRYELAQTEVQKLQALSGGFESEDGAYLTQVITMLVSYAGAIKRHKRILTEELHSADLEYKGLQRRIVSDRIFSAGWTAATKIGMMSVLFGIGASLARTLVPFIPDGLAEDTGKFSPSILLGLTFVMVGRIISMMWSDRKQAIIVNRLNERVDAAWEVFGQRRLNEYRQHLCDLCEVWKLYIGTKYNVVSSIEVVLEDDLDTRRTFVLRKKQIAKSPFDLLYPHYCKLRGWVGSRLKRSSPPSTQQVLSEN